MSMSIWNVKYRYPPGERNGCKMVPSARRNLAPGPRSRRPRHSAGRRLSSRPPGTGFADHHRRVRRPADHHSRVRVVAPGDGTTKEALAVGVWRNPDCIAPGRGRCRHCIRRAWSLALPRGCTTLRSTRDRLGQLVFGYTTPGCRGVHAASSTRTIRSSCRPPKRPQIGSLRDYHLVRRRYNNLAPAPRMRCRLMLSQPAPILRRVDHYLYATPRTLNRPSNTTHHDRHRIHVSH